jgi:hypothetical protein
MPKKYYYFLYGILTVVLVSILVYVWLSLIRPNILLNNTTKQALVSPQSNWQQISDPILGFRFDFPDTYKASVLQSTKDRYPEVNHNTPVTNFIGAVNFKSNSDPDAYPSITVFAYSKNNETFNAWLSNNQVLKNDFSTQESSIIGGNQYIKYSHPAGIYAPAEIYIAEGNQMIYRIDFAADFKGTKQLVETSDILKTFKFTK